MEKVDGADADKTELIKLDLFMDPDKPASNYSQNFANFKYGFSDESIKWLMFFGEIENLMPMK
jgi:hypothetical protein